MITRREFLKLTAAMAAAGTMTQIPGTMRRARASVKIAQIPLAGKVIPKFVEPMPVFGPAGGVPRVSGQAPVTVVMGEVQQKVLPVSYYDALAGDYKKGTWLWAYQVGNLLPFSYYPGISIEAQQGVPTDVTYINNLPLTGSMVQQYLTFDQSIHWAAPTGDPMMVGSGMNMVGNPAPYYGPPPAVVHLHGAEVLSDYDGGPTGWFTPNGIHGKGYRTYLPTASNANVYHYENTQEATTLWFHDHVLGATRLNVYAGMAAFYLLRDQYDSGLATNPLGLPAGEFEIEIAIQDRQFDTNGQWFFPDSSMAGLNGPVAQPLIHPNWIPEFFGDVMVVNGKSWPYFNVEPRRYRLRLLDGCNARFLALDFMNLVTGLPGPDIFVIGNDGGLMDVPARITSPNNQLLMAPGERYDVIVDFSAFAGQTLTLTNSAKAPYPHGMSADPQTTGQVIQFRVAPTVTSPDVSFNPAAAGAYLRGSGKMPAIIRLVSPKTGTVPADVKPSLTRQLVLVEVAGPAGPVEVLVNNNNFDGLRTDGAIIAGSQPNSDGHYMSELPRVGDTEIWEIVNLTMDAHPIHTHLVQFQLLNRQPFQAGKYRAAYDALFPGGTFKGVVGKVGATALWDNVTYPAGVFIPGYGGPLPYDGSNILSGGKKGGNPDVTSYLQGKINPPTPEESGWKDTIKAYPGEVTRILVRIAPQDADIATTFAGVNKFAFDPTQGPGYVWHCHIVDHEDNDMMRPYIPVP